MLFAADLPSPRSDAFLTSLADKPGPLLMSLARQARDEGRFHDAILLMDKSLDSPWGRKAFKAHLKEALASAEEGINAAARPRLMNILSPAQQKDHKFLGLFLREDDTDRSSGMQRMHLELKSLLHKPIPEAMFANLLKRSAELVQASLKTAMPQNPVRFFPNNKRYIMEGYFNSEYPVISTEAQLELGLLYKSTSDFVLAEHYLKDALNGRQYLPVKGREYELRYSLAEMYLVQGKFYDYEKLLKEIAARDASYISLEGAPARLRAQMRSVFLTDAASLDKVLQLYRLSDDFSRAAEQKLGAMYVQRGDYEDALMPLLFAAVKPVSKAMEEIRERNYEFSFSTLSAFLQEARNYPDIMEYLDKSSFYEVLFNLSRAAPGYQPNNLRPSRLIWAFLAAAEEAGPYRPLAAEELRKLRR